jgi:hypothetical protein
MRLVYILHSMLYLNFSIIQNHEVEQMREMVRVNCNLQVEWEVFE